MLKLNKNLYSMVLLSCGFVLTSCQNRRRGLEVGSDASLVDVKLTGPITQETNKDAWKYEFICANSGKTEGVFASPDNVAFKLAGVKVNETCQLNVLTSNPSPKIKFSGEQNVMYWAKAMLIRQNPDGSLFANVSPTSLYEMDSAVVDVENPDDKDPTDPDGKEVVVETEEGQLPEDKSYDTETGKIE
jgi:hypothetical protein